LKTHLKQEIAYMTDKRPRIEALLIQGMTNLEIAQSLGLAEKTVKAYMTGLMKQYDKSNRTALALHLYKSLPPDPWKAAAEAVPRAVLISVRDWMDSTTNQDCLLPVELASAIRLAAATP
jgi:DNA-binding CsgD family transcriptional regulator